MGFVKKIVRYIRESEYSHIQKSFAISENSGDAEPQGVMTGPVLMNSVSSVLASRSTFFIMTMQLNIFIICITSLLKHNLHSFFLHNKDKKLKTRKMEEVLAIPPVPIILLLLLITTFITKSSSTVPTFSKIKTVKDIPERFFINKRILYGKRYMYWLLSNRSSLASCVYVGDGDGIRVVLSTPPSWFSNIPVLNWFFGNGSNVWKKKRRLSDETLNIRLAGIGKIV